MAFGVVWKQAAPRLETCWRWLLHIFSAGCESRVYLCRTGVRRGLGRRDKQAVLIIILDYSSTEGLAEQRMFARETFGEFFLVGVVVVGGVTMKILMEWPCISVSGLASYSGKSTMNECLRRGTT